VIEDVRHFIGTEKVYDDITLLVIKEKAMSGQKQHYEKHIQ